MKENKKFDVISFLRELEEKYDVSSIRVKNIKVWPILRNIYAFESIDQFISHKPLKYIPIKKLKKIKNIFYGIDAILSNHKYLIFSDTGERRIKINDIHVDRKAECLINILGKNDVLMIENPANSSHYKRDIISSRNIVSADIFKILSFFFYPFTINLLIENSEMLDEINKKYKLNINYRKIIRQFLCYVKIFNLFFKLWKPKFIFISCYYSLINSAVIYASNIKGIKTIELQHGIINKEHFAYNIFTKVNNKFYPNYLFAFGDYIKDIFTKDNCFINEKNVFSIGSFYIDYINNNYIPTSKISELFSNYRKKYRRIITVSSQDTIDEKLIDFINRSAYLCKEILFIFVPRNFKKDYQNIFKVDNIILLKEKDLDIYKIIKESDFHSTVYSTCALEALALGIPNILINIDNFAKKYYSNLLFDETITKFVDKPNEYIDTILNWQPIGKEEIINRSKLFFKPNHKKSLKEALEGIGIKIKQIKE